MGNLAASPEETKERLTVVRNAISRYMYDHLRNPEGPAQKREFSILADLELEIHHSLEQVEQGVKELDQETAPITPILDAPVAVAVPEQETAPILDSETKKSKK